MNLVINVSLQTFFNFKFLIGNGMIWALGRPWPWAKSLLGLGPFWAWSLLGLGPSRLFFNALRLMVGNSSRLWALGGPFRLFCSFTKGNLQISIRGLCVMKCSIKILQYLSYFWGKNTQFYLFSFLPELYESLLVSFCYHQQFSNLGRKYEMTV